MSESWDVVVAGAGIVGAACAKECAARGLRTAIVEAGEIGGGATAAGMGHIVVMDDSPAQLALTKYARSLWQKLSSDLPAAVEYEERGTVWIAAEVDELAAVQTKHAACTAAEIRSEILDSAALADAEPNLRPGLAGALFVPEDAVLYPPTAATGLLHAAEERGAHLIRATVTKAGHGAVTLADGTTLASDHIVVATGADFDLVPWIRLKKRKGHLVITDRYPGFVRHQLVEPG